MTAPMPVSPASQVGSGDWKMIRLICGNADQSDPYGVSNLTTGRGERNNLATSQFVWVKKLSARLDSNIKTSPVTLLW